MRTRTFEFPHAREEHRQLCRRGRNARMRFCRSNDLQTEAVGEIRPAVVHHDHLRATEALEGLFPDGDSLIQPRQVSTAIGLESGAFAGRRATRPARIDAVIGCALRGSSQ